MTLVLPLRFFKFHDILLGVTGLVANILLFMCIRKRTSHVFKHFGRLIMLSCVNDIIYSTMIILIQRIIDLRAGIPYHFGFGIEKYLPFWLSMVFEFIILAACVQSVSILPTQYYFRYVVISKVREPTTRLLVSLVSLSTLASCLFASLGVWSCTDALRRGKDYYTKPLAQSWFEADGSSRFVHAADIQDLSTLILYIEGCIVTSTCINVSFLYAYKTVKLMNSPIGGEPLSKNTRAMTRQFTRNLLLQSLVALVSAVFPSSMLCSYVTMHIHAPVFEGKGPFLSSMYAWTPAANAIVAICVIRPYRNYVLELFHIRQAGSSSRAKRFEPTNVSGTAFVSTTYKTSLPSIG